MNRDQFLSLSLTDLSFKELVALFKRRRWVVFGTFLFCIAAGLGISALIPPTWRANTVVVVEGKTQSNNALPSDMVGILTQTSVDYDVLTQIQIMNSFTVFYNALKRINYDIPAQLGEEEYAKLPKASIQQIQTTNTVQVAVEDKDDAVAVQLASAIPEVYKEMVLEEQQDNVKRSFDFVTARLDEENKNLQTALQELAAYKEEHNIADSKTEAEIRAGQYAEAQRKLAEVEGDVKAQEVGVHSAEAAYKAMPEKIDNPTSITPVDTLSRAREVLSNLKTQRDAVLVNNMPDSDRVIRIDAQIKGQAEYLAKLESQKQVSAASTMRNPMRDEMEKSYLFSKASREGALAKLESLRQTVAEKRADIGAFAKIAAKEQMLEVKTGQVDTQVTRLLGIQNEIRLRNNALQSPIKNVTGKTPAQFVRPILSLNLALAGLIGLFLGCVLALIRDVSLDKVNSSGEAAMIAEKDLLGRIPLRASARDPLIADPQKARAFEAYRILRNSILLAGPDKKVFLVTSTLPKEGKSTVAANLAVAMALEGKRTILVDGNLRNPAVHKLFKVDQGKGVAEVLSNQLSLSEALKTTNVPNLALLTAGADAPNPTELVASQAMKDLVAKLADQADIVLIDAPAAFGFADSQSLVTAAPDVVYVTQLEAPGKSQMREAVGMIDFAGGKILGLVLNKDKWAINRARGA